MGRMIVLLVAYTFLITGVSAQLGIPGMGMGMGEQPKAAAVPSDIKYIRCQVCEVIMKHATRHVKTMVNELKPGHKLHESDIIEFLEKMCDPSKPDGKWITNYDIQESGDALKLVDMGQQGKCDTECATIARACSQISDALDLSDLSEALFLGKSRSALAQLACYKTTNVCTSKPPPVPKDRPLGPAHQPMSADEIQREQMMASMKAAGLGGQMYNRDDMMNQINDLQERSDAGEFPEVAFTETGQEPKHKGVSGLAAEVADQVAKAGEVVRDVVGQAKEAAAAAVDKAGSFLKQQLGKLTGSGGQSKAAEQPATEL
eukprot:GHRR01006929.1.p1 GENE.GHRR01006929.1~~GHRR01006929.1.p1  ORF type:complete len:317 (+),score=90.33 GHRR01006929.1:203-1153(+)